jgi:NAD(P)-dependent dehydrogenase (short-subunit alcohol dehydrogenase family)
MTDTHKEDSRGTLIVTGSGRGIGAAVAKLAGGRGFRVVVNYARNAQAAADVARAIVSSGGRAPALIDFYVGAKAPTPFEHNGSDFSGRAAGGSGKQ